MPELAALYLQGRLRLDELITHEVRLDEVESGFGALRDGSALRVVLDLDQG